MWPIIEEPSWCLIAGSMIESISKAVATNAEAQAKLKEIIVFFLTFEWRYLHSNKSRRETNDTQL